MILWLENINIKLITLLILCKIFYQIMLNIIDFNINYFMIIDQ